MCSWKGFGLSHNQGKIYSKGNHINHLLIPSKLLGFQKALFGRYYLIKLMILSCDPI